MTISEPQNQTDLDRIASAHSPFDRIYLVDFNNRYKHIEFDNTMTSKVLTAIKNPDITPVLNMLLSD